MQGPELEKSFLRLFTETQRKDKRVIEKAVILLFPQCAAEAFAHKIVASESAVTWLGSI